MKAKQIAELAGKHYWPYQNGFVTVPASYFAYNFASCFAYGGTYSSGGYAFGSVFAIPLSKRREIAEDKFDALWGFVSCGFIPQQTSYALTCFEWFRVFWSEG